MRAELSVLLRDLRSFEPGLQSRVQLAEVPVSQDKATEISRSDRISCLRLCFEGLNSSELNTRTAPGDAFGVLHSHGCNAPSCKHSVADVFKATLIIRIDLKGIKRPG